jgi:hypothetical protein
MRTFINIYKILNKTLTSQGSLFPASNLERLASQCYPNIRSFVWKGHRVDNNVKASLTFAAPIMRQMATSSSITPSTATTTPTLTSTETDTHRNVRLAFGEMQENPNLKLRNNV